MDARLSRKPTGLSYKRSGEIYKGEQRVGKVDCDLIEYEEYVTTHEAGTRKPLQGPTGKKRFQGGVTVVDGNEPINLDGSILTLHFESDLPQIQIVLSNPKRDGHGHWTYPID
jgi:hypothetical protein